MKHVKTYENITDGKYKDYGTVITIPSFTLDVYLPELYGKGLLDYGGPNDDSVQKDMIQLVKDNLERIKGLQPNINNQKTSEEYQWYKKKLDTGDDRTNPMIDTTKLFNI